MNNGRLGRFDHWRYGALAFVLIVGPAWAVTAPPVTPTRIFDMRPVMDGVTGKITYQLGSGSGVSYLTKTVGINKAVLGSLAKGFLKGGLANLALNALIAGAGYLWNESTQQFMTPGTPGGAPCANGYWHDVGPYSFPDACTSADSQLLFEAAVRQSQTSEGMTDIVIVYTGVEYDYWPNLNLGYDVDYTYLDGTHRHEHTQMQIKHYDGAKDSPDLPPAPIDVADQDLGELIVSQGSPDLWQWLLTDPTTGAPITTPSIKQQIWDIQKEQVQEAGGDPLAVPEPTTSGDVTTLSSEEAKPSDWPDFCAWAKPVCDFFEFEEPPLDEEPPKVPVIDMQPQTWSSGLPSTATCPPPVVIELPAVFGSSISISYQPFCEFAAMVQPLVLAAAYLAAAFILIRGL